MSEPFADFPCPRCGWELDGPDCIERCRAKGDDWPQPAPHPSPEPPDPAPEPTERRNWDEIPPWERRR